MNLKGLVLIAAILAALTSCNNGGGVSINDNAAIGTELDTVSYMIGNSIGSSLKRDGLDTTLNRDILLSAIIDVYEGKDPKIAKAEGEIVVRNYFQKMQQAQMEKQRKDMEVQFKDNKEAGIKFLEENKDKEGIMVTESGLQYEILSKGDGDVPTASDKVKVNYKGTLIDGTVFDQTKEEPIEFDVTGVIRGWTEALLLMPVGSKWKLYIPAELAYNDRQMGEHIMPYSALVFEVELLEIVKK